jgi:hypothetical protein
LCPATRTNSFAKLAGAVGAADAAGFSAGLEVTIFLPMASRRVKGSSSPHERVDAHASDASGIA